MRARPLSLAGPRRSSPWGYWVGLAVIGMGLGVALMALLARPILLETAPAPAAHHISPRAVLRFTFNRPMNVATLASTLDPPMPGTWGVENSEVVFTPAAAWPENSVVTVTLAGGRAANGVPWWGAQTLTFTVAGPRLAFIKGVVPNVWVLPLESPTEVYSLTAEPYGVYNYSFSSDGAQLVYAALRADGGADIRVRDLARNAPAQTLLACPEAACLSPVFAPDGQALAYERQSLITLTVGRVSFGESQVHLYTLATDVDETQPGQDTRFPHWGPDGRLSFFDTEKGAIVVRTLSTGAVTYLPNATGQMGTWSPDGRTLIYPDLFAPPEGAALPGENFVEHFFSRLMRVTIATNVSENLSGPDLVSDVSPVFSPSGEWVVFARRGLAPATWTLGRQLWLMRADGSEARPLTAAPAFNHSAFVWNPAETTIFYMRYNAGDPVAPAEIWHINRATTEAHLLTIGYLPEWIP